MKFLVMKCGLPNRSSRLDVVGTKVRQSALSEDGDTSLETPVERQPSSLVECGQLERVIATRSSSHDYAPRRTDGQAVRQFGASWLVIEVIPRKAPGGTPPMAHDG